MDAVKAADLAVSMGATKTDTVFRDGGWAVTAQFDNGFGVSIIDHAFSYALEMAVTHPNRLCYQTPVTSDVLGYLSDDGLRDAVAAVAALPPADHGH